MPLRKKTAVVTYNGSLALRLVRLLPYLVNRRHTDLQDVSLEFQQLVGGKLPFNAILQISEKVIFNSGNCDIHCSTRVLCLSPPPFAFSYLWVFVSVTVEEIKGD